MKKKIIIISFVSLILVLFAISFLAPFRDSRDELCAIPSDYTNFLIVDSSSKAIHSYSLCNSLSEHYPVAGKIYNSSKSVTVFKFNSPTVFPEPKFTTTNIGRSYTAINTYPIRTVSVVESFYKGGIRDYFNDIRIYCDIPHSHVTRMKNHYVAEGKFNTLTFKLYNNVDDIRFHKWLPGTETNYKIELLKKELFIYLIITIYD